MLFLYDLGIQFYKFLILLASLKSKKAEAWIQGRKNLLLEIEDQLDKTKRPIWFHFASLGEFEQGRTVLEELKARQPGSSIFITFFSPSGYEIRKDYNFADHVFYLPLDTKKNAREFIRIVRPSIAIFTKYEYWYHYFAELHRNNVPLFMISAIFRQNQPFFKWYGSLHRRMLAMVSHFFVQNQLSKDLLNTSGFKNVSIAGDTRFDRVVKNASQVKTIDQVKEFCGDDRIFIAGSTWLEDETLITSLTEKYPDWKFIIAPHEIRPERIGEVENLYPDPVKFSACSPSVNNYRILIIDNIGMLSSLYQYADVAYIGGGFGVGIHNTQEAAAFNLPVIFGPNYHKFSEACALIDAGAAFSVKNNKELMHVMSSLQDRAFREETGKIGGEYIRSNIGATETIVNYIHKYSM
ncbi:MAG: glycosyltransferase N-terminal domain-containing protein [Daejeonella sp.]